MSPPGRPKGEYRSAQHAGDASCPPGRPKGEYLRSQHDGGPVGASRLRPRARTLPAADRRVYPLESAMPGYVYLWEYRVRPAHVREFERAYGPGGDWDALFRRGAGYLGTDLCRDADDPLRYVTVDRWTSRDACEAFLRRFRAEYARVDDRTSSWTLAEHLLGHFATLGTASRLLGAAPLPGLLHGAPRIGATSPHEACRTAGSR